MFRHKSTTFTDRKDAGIEVGTKQREEIRRRIIEYRDGRPLPELKNRIVIIADDGIATGSTIVPSLKLCRSRKASKVIVATPVSGHSYASEIDELADDIQVVQMPDDFYAVGQVYEDFHGLEDYEVTDFLNDLKTIN